MLKTGKRNIQFHCIFAPSQCASIELGLTNKFESLLTELKTDIKNDFKEDLNQLKTKIHNETTKLNEDLYRFNNDTNDRLDKISDDLGQLKIDFKEDLKQLKTDIISAFTSHFKSLKEQQDLMYFKLNMTYNNTQDLKNRP